MDCDSKDLGAEEAKLLEQLQAVRRAKKEKEIEEAAARRREAQGLNGTAAQLAPASPEAAPRGDRERSKARDALLYGNKTNTSAALLKDPRRVKEAEQEAEARRRRALASTSTSSSSFASSSDLGTLLDGEASNHRLAKRFNEAPSNLLDATAAMRKRMKQNEAQRGLAGQRSSRFGEAAPKQQQQQHQYRQRTTTASASASAIGNGHVYSRSNRGDNYDFKGKGVDRSGGGGGSSSSSSNDPHGGGSIMLSKPNLAQEIYERNNPQIRNNGTSGSSTGRYASGRYNNEEEEEEGGVKGGYRSGTRRGGDASNAKELDEYGFFESSQQDEGQHENRLVSTKRNEDLTVAHDLKPGPVNHRPLRDDPHFETVEPNSKIRLKERILPHEDLQEHLSDRYYLPHETLYSIVRPSRGGLEYEVPVEGDWIVIGVLAEKSEIKYTGAGSASNMVKQMEMRKRQEAEKRKKARDAAAAAAAARRKRQQGQGKGQGQVQVQGKDGSRGFDDAMFDDLARSDEELNEAFADSDVEGDGKATKKRKDKSDEDDERESAAFRRRYITFKLIDLGQKNAGGGAGVLSLKLFESDPEQRRRTKAGNSDDDEEEVHEVFNKRTGKRTLVKKRRGDARRERERAENGGEDDEKDRFERKEYKGGSNGAFEKFWKERDGAVIAILNPRIMKPWTHPSQENNPNANILSITPESADSIIVIGRSKDLGACEAKRKDGNICQAWYDKRMDVPVCDFHREAAVRARRAGRAELLQGTGGLQTSKLSNGDMTAYSRNAPPRRSGREYCGGVTVGQSAATYDPVNRVGLLPRNNISVQEGAKTYVVPGAGRGASVGQGASNQGGHRTGVSGVQAPSNASYRPGGNGGRKGLLGAPDWDGKANVDPKTRREQEQRQDSSLKELLAKDSSTAGAKYLQKNRSHLPNRSKSSGKGKTQQDDSASHSEQDTDGGGAVANDAVKAAKKRIFAVDALRKIGFDPTALPAESDARQEQRKLEAVRQLGNPETYVPKLDRPAGPKVRSGVRAPTQPGAAADVNPAGAARSRQAEADTVDDWDDLVADVAHNTREVGASVEDADQPRKKLCRDTGAQHDSGYHASSDADQGVEHKAMHEDEESDLEIEPPVQ